MKLRSPAGLMAAGVAATLVLALAVVLELLWFGGGVGAVTDNTALIGALVALGGVFTAQMVSIALEERRANEAALRSYLQDVGKLLIEKQLHQASPGNTLRTVVRAQTLAVLEGLDPDRKRILLLFLYESGLISTDKPSVDFLRVARQLHADKPIVVLSAADLRRADLRAAMLHDVDLSGARLSQADLSRSDLSSARGITNEELETSQVS